MYNRTFSKAQRLASEFDATAIRSLEELEFDDLELVLSTVPPQADLKLPSGFLKSRPTVFDVVYIPYWTPLLKKAKESDCITIHGRDMLIAQGTQQLEWWTGREAPEKNMAKAVIDFTKTF